MAGLGLRRRQILQLISAGAVVVGAEVARAAGYDTEAEFEQTVLQMQKDGDAWPVLIIVPRHLDADRRHPGVVFLHGYGQAMHPESAIYAWRDDYGLLSSYARLESPPITRELEQHPYLTDARQARINSALSNAAFQGLVMICPLTPVPYYSGDPDTLFATYADWLVDALLPRARERAPLSADAMEIGIAGMSMGGQVALEVMARRPDGFRALTAIQAAIEPWSARGYAARIHGAFQTNDDRAVKIVTSTYDPSRRANEELYQRLVAAGVKASFQAPPGPHNAAWMWEIGSLETLLWQDRALRGVPAVTSTVGLPSR